MSVLDSLFVGLFGLSVVFVVLVGLSLLVMIQSALVKRFTAKKAGEAVPEPAAEAADGAGAAPEPLRLINVDEKTAAIIMAIVCDEMQAQPEELQFKSIRALPEEDHGESGEKK